MQPTGDLTPQTQPLYVAIHGEGQVTLLTSSFIKKYIYKITKHLKNDRKGKLICNLANDFNHITFHPLFPYLYNTIKYEQAI